MSAPQQAMNPSQKVTVNLKSSSLGFLETIGQSLANISPTFTPAINVVAVAGLAGGASWLVYGVSTLGLLFVGLNIAVLASRFAAAGSFFIFISRALGPVAGGIAGWGLIAAYTGTAMGVLAGEAIFVQNAFSPWGITIPIYMIYIVSVVLVWFLSSRDIKLSSRLSLGIEAASIAIVGAVLLLVFYKHPGHIFDMNQITLSGASSKGFAEALVLGVFSFVGFESAASLGKETKDPLRFIPRAVIWSMLLAGGFFMFVAYSMVIAYGGDTAKLGNDSAPLLTLAKSLGMSPLGPLFYIVASISAFACVLASINAASRLLFSMGRYQFVHRSMGMVHTRHQTPHYAVAFACSITLIAVLALIGTGTINTFGYTATFATFGFMLAYFLISVSAPVYLKKEGSLSVKNIVIGALGGLAMIGAVIGSVYPVPAYPYNILPYLFIGYLVIGFIWLVVLKKRSPQVLEKIEHDLESSQSEIFGRK